MSKFFVKDENIGADTIIIEGVDASHICKVLRHKVSDEITVCDGNLNDYKAILIVVSEKRCIAKIISKEICKTEPNIFVTLFQALPKGDKSESIIQKCTELGISQIVFFISQRCVSRPDKKALEAKLKRFNEIAMSAAKQCNRGIVPKILFEPSFENMLKSAKNADLSVFFYENAKENSFKEILKNNKNIKTFSFIIGSEGGFEEEEFKKAAQQGLYIGGLGQRILRCETAPVCVLSAFVYESGNL